MLTGTVIGLVPGINSLEVFKNGGERRAVAGLKVARAKAPSATCSTASFPADALPVPNTVVTSATPVVATPTVPAHCLVAARSTPAASAPKPARRCAVSRYTYAINWQARLPDAWNSKFHMPGGGGTDGSVPSTTTRLRQGYAAAANDSGTATRSTATRLPAAPRRSAPITLRASISPTTPSTSRLRTAKELVEMYYDDRPEFSYFEGCSMGGREAMMVTQRLPSHFDGSVSGDPAFRITKVRRRGRCIRPAARRAGAHDAT